MNELMVPRGPETARRIHGFFESIGWDVRENSETDREVLTSPDTGAFLSPTIAYWQTDNPVKTIFFKFNPNAKPSEYAKGLRLPRIFELVEVVMIVPSDDHVHDIFDRGGRLLEAHTHQQPREHAGRQEFRFNDPFNYALRVTANPGYEVNLSDEPLVGKQIDHDEGTSYVIEDVILDATGYEVNGVVSRKLRYTQTMAGNNPAGTEYVRSEEELLHGTMPGEPETPIFRIQETE